MKSIAKLLADAAVKTLRAYAWLTSAPARLALVVGVLCMLLGVWIYSPPAALIIVGIGLIWIARESVSDV